MASAVTLAHLISLLRRQLSSLCRLRDISLRPEGVFPQGEALLKGRPYRIDFSKNFSKKVDERLKMRYTVYC